MSDYACPISTEYVSPATAEELTALAFLGYVYAAQIFTRDESTYKLTIPTGDKAYDECTV